MVVTNTYASALHRLNFSLVLLRIHGFDGVKKLLSFGNSVKVIDLLVKGTQC